MRVQPNAAHNRVGGFREGVLRLSVTAPPADGKANAAVLALLAEALDTPKSRLEIIRGHSTREKVVAVESFTLEQVERRLGQCAT